MDIDRVLTRGVSAILPGRDELKKLMQERPITLYQGFDPTAKSLHIGNFIGIRKLAQFQKLGHKVIFLIGDGTGQAGDPSGKLATREKFFNNAELLENAKSWKEQTKHIIEFEGDNAVEIRYNSTWLNKLNLVDFLNIAQHFTVQQMIERDMFQKRLEKGAPINLREFIYPLLQGYDSVAMEVDLEIGGNDQLFNMMAGRTLLKNMKQKEKFVLTTKLLTDASGKKMGKSEGNAINLTDSPEDIYGKVMAFPDSMLEVGYELLTDIDEIASDPMVAKKNLAFDLVRQIKGEDEAKNAQNHFEETFQNNNPDFKVVEKGDNAVKTFASAAEISNSEVKRLISQGAIQVNSQKIDNFNIELKSGDKIKIGERVFIEIK